MMNTHCDVPNFEKPPWEYMVLVTPHNIMHKKWNTSALHKHCQKTGELLYICQAKDTVGKEQQEPSLEEMTIAAGLNPEEDLQRLHTRIEIMVGMKAMVTINSSTEADLANGTKGIITNIILDHRETLEKTEVKNGIVTLLYPPAMIIFNPLEPTSTI